MPSETPPSRVKNAWRMSGKAREAAWIMRLLCRHGDELDASGLAGLPVRLDDNFHIAIEAGQEAHQAVDRIFAEMSFEHARDLRLADPHPLAGLCLRQLPPVRQPVYFRDDLGFEEMIVGIG